MKYPVYLALLAATACQSLESPRHFDLENNATLTIQVVDTTLLSGLALSHQVSAKHFYVSRKMALGWFEAGKRLPVADSLMEEVRTAAWRGLVPEDYHLEDLDDLFRKDSLASEDLARMDIFLTDAYLSLYQHLRYGRLDQKTLQRLPAERAVNLEAVMSLRNLASTSVREELNMREPDFGQYRMLKHALGAYCSLGVDSAERLRGETLAMNLERWRWRTRPPNRYIEVNIPAFTLRAIEQDSVWLRTAVIVGKRETPTPVLASVIRSFIIYPYWHVPYSISTREILPSLKSDPSYLRTRNFDVLDRRGTVINSDTIRWDKYSPEWFPFVLRQREGSENTMGIIKFNFANKHNVYLHDTNSKRLYQRARRDLSHGCVRVKEAVALAHYLVREDDIYVSPEDLDQYLSLQQRLEIDLRKPISLRLEYFTAEVKDGLTLFYDDIYKKDSVMVAELYRTYRPTAQQEQPFF